MAEMSPNPSVSQVNESGSTNPANANIRVAKFAGQLAQSGRANGGNFRSEQIERLVSRLAVPAEPQSENVDPDLSATASAILEELAEAIDTEESKIGIGTKLLALIISWFGGDSYDTAIAKQAFRSIENKETRTALLVLAFEAATVPADPEKESDMQENMQAVLKFCQEVEVEVKDLASGLAKGGTDGAECLRWLVEDNRLEFPKFTDDAAKELVLGLADQRYGAECLETLLEHNKLDMPKFTVEAAKEFVLGLANNPVGNGLTCLNTLLEHNKLDLPKFTGEAAKELVLGVAGNPGRSKYLELLIGKLPIFTADEAKGIVLGLAEKRNGVLCLWVLFENHKFVFPKFEGDEAKQVVLELAEKPEGTKILGWLLNFNDRLLDLKNVTFMVDEAKGLVLELAKGGPWGANCLQQLLKENNLNLGNEAFTADEAKEIVLGLASGSWSGALSLEQLFERGMLENLEPKEGTSLNAFKAEALRLITSKNYNMLKPFLKKALVE